MYKYEKKTNELRNALRVERGKKRNINGKIKKKCGGQMLRVTKKVQLKCVRSGLAGGRWGVCTL